MNPFIGKLLVLVGADTNEFQKGLQDMEKRLKRTATQFEQAGRSMIKGFTIPLTAIGAAAFKFAGDFDKAMTQSTSIMGEMSDAMRQDLEATARNLSRESTFAAKELAGAYYFLASAGLDAQQSIAALPKVARFATAGQFDLAKSTELLTDAQSAMGLTVKDATANVANMTRVSDALVKANIIANASVLQFSESLTNQAGPALRIVGKDIEEGLAVLAAFADQGIKAEEAGTRLSIVLRDLQRSSIEAQDQFTKFNIRVFDSSGEMRNMADILGDLENAMAGMSDEQKRATLMMLKFNDRSVASLLALVGYSDKIREYEKRIRSAGSVTDDVARKQLANMQDQFTMLKNVFVDVGITIGRALAPAFEMLRVGLEALAQVLHGVARTFEELPEWLRKIVSLMALVTAGIGPVLLAVGILIKSVLSLVASLRQLAVVLAFLRSHPIGLLLTALGLIAAAFTAYQLGASMAAAETKNLGEAVSSTASALERAKARYEGLQKAIEETRQNLFEARQEWVKAKQLLEGKTKNESPAFASEALALAAAAHDIDMFGEKIITLERRMISLRDAAAATKLDMDIATAKEAYAAFGAELEKGLRVYGATGNEVEGLNTLLRAQETLFKELTEIKTADTGVLRNLAVAIEDTKKKRDALTASIERQKVAQEAAAKAEEDYKQQMAKADLVLEATGDRTRYLGEKLQALEGYFDKLAEAPGASIEELRKLDAQAKQTKEELDALSKTPIKLTVAWGKEDLANAKVQWATFVNDLAISATDLVETLTQIFQQFAQSFGTAIASVIVYGQGMAEAMRAMAKDILSSLITMLIRLGIQQLAYAILGVAAIAKETSAKMAGYAMQTYAAAYAASIGPLTAMALFGGPALAAGLAAAAVATMLGGAASSGAAGAALGGGITAAAEGGIVMQPTLALVGERGNEAILPLNRLEDFLPADGTTHVYLEMDGRTMAKLIVPHTPGVIRRTIGRRTI